MTDLAVLWRNKIVRHSIEDPAALIKHPLNWRLHPDFQQEALAGAIDEIGFIQSVTVNQQTGRIVNGHLRVTLAIRDKQPGVPVEWVDLSEEEERKALYLMDPIAALALQNEELSARTLDDVIDETVNETVQEVLESLRINIELGEAAEDGLERRRQQGGGKASPYKTDRQGLLKPVLRVSEIAVLEEALAATGLPNRAEALVEICRSYLDRGRLDL